ncbi:hypothetical protein HMI55_001685 [Coelomomyces lativittatus]|nr:hypothetical protein HMI55_001685 [Coelomomyces lativittatus]
MDKQPLDIKHCLMHYQLDTFFPCICEGDPLTLPTTSFSSSSSSSSLIQSFDFKYFSTLNQVVTLCLHLRQDMNLTNHKYIAHQLALLYQSLGNTREDLKVFKSEIESQFDVIKAVCSVSEGDPKLSPDQRDWVRDLSTRILTQTLFHQRTTTSNTTTTTTPPILDTYPCTPFYQLLQSL